MTSADVPSPEDFADEVWEWDQALIQDPNADILAFAARCAAQLPRQRLLIELLRCQGERLNWDAAWVDRARAILIEACGNHDAIGALAREIFEDQLAQGVQPRWTLFAKFELPAEQLALRAPQDALSLGQIIGGRYLLEERLGSGKFGVVYRARDILTGLVAAVKAPAGRDLQQRLEAAKLLRLESEALRVTAGKGLPQWYELYADPVSQLPLLVMEFVEGQLLVNATLPLEPQRAVRICRDLARILDRLHANQYLHRDLKPENIMLLPDDEVVLLDFGLAITEAAQFADDAASGGTRPFMSIEALLGMHTQMDARSDIFAVGAVLYELLTGRPVTRGESKEEAFVDAVVRRELSFPESVPAEVRQICECCLARDPNDRFDTAALLAAALDNCLTGGSGAAAEDSFLLFAWRLGRIYGQFAEHVGNYTAQLRLASQLVDTDLAKATVAAGGAAMYAMGVSTSVEELRKQLSTIDVAIAELPGESHYQRALYRQAKLIASGELAQMLAVDQELRQRVEELYEQLLKETGQRSAVASKLFTFAIQGTLSPSGPMAAQELQELGTSARIPAPILDLFVAAIAQNAKPDIVRKELDRLSLGVERWLLRG